MGIVHKIIDRLSNRSIKVKLNDLLSGNQVLLNQLTVLTNKTVGLKKDVELLQQQNGMLQQEIMDVQQDLKKHVIPTLFELKRFDLNWLNYSFDAIGLDGENKERAYNKSIETMELFPIKEVSGVKNYSYCRIGRAFDGGYVMLDDFRNVQIAYSFGICDDVSWDTDMAKRGIQVYMYDHTIDKIPHEDNNFHFFKLGIKGIVDQNPCLETLSNILISNGHADEKNMILKLDVEGAEWEVLSSLNEEVLNQFRQIVIEFHDVNNYDRQSLIKCALTNINKTHQLVHIHANNYSMGNIVERAFLPDSIEATYLNKKQYEFVNVVKSFPTSLDMPNNPTLSDINLGRWNVEERE